MNVSTLGKTVLVVLLVCCYFLARGHHAPPRPVSQAAPETTYSAERAFAHILHIAAEPHPAGSAQANKVRDYIMAQIRAMGLEPELQEAMVYRPPATAASVHNVLVRLTGASGGGDAVALMAHYDSVAFGPGAADDGAGVAAMLEAMRALSSGPAFLNDIIFIFTDGEEGRLHGGTGLRGAYAFVEQHPWAEDVRVVINFDARGVRGPTYMYQTSGKNAWLIEQLARARCNAAATSLSYEVYDRMPVGSDLTAFIQADIPGYDCAFIHGLEKYHTMLDAPAYLSLASLQHNGEYAHPLARHLANQPLSDAANVTENLVYFDFPGNRLVRYSENTALLLIFLVLALYLALLTFGLRRGELSMRGILCAAGCNILWLALCCCVGAAAMLAGYRARGVYILYSSDELTLGILLICAGATVLVYNRIMDKAGVYNTLLGFLAPWAALLVPVFFFMPGATYYITWPLLFALLPIGAGLFNRNTSKTAGLGGALLLAVAAFPTLLFTVGVLKGFYAALLFIFVSLHIAVILLAATMLMAHIRIVTGPVRGRVAALLVLLGIVPLLMGVFWPGFSAQQPKFNAITYGLNADTGEAFFMSSDDAPDSWTEQFLGAAPSKASITEFIPIAERKYLKAPAPALAIEAPTLEALSDITEGDRRSLRLLVDSPRGAEVVEMYALPETDVLAASVNGVVMEITEAPWRLSYSIYRGGGIVLELTLPADSPARFRVADHQYFLENILDFEPRPPHTIPKPNTVDFNRDPLKSEESIVVATFDLAPEEAP